MQLPKTRVNGSRMLQLYVPTGTKSYDNDDDYDNTQFQTVFQVSMLV